MRQCTGEPKYLQLCTLLVSMKGMYHLEVFEKAYLDRLLYEPFAEQSWNFLFVRTFACLFIESDIKNEKRSRKIQTGLINCTNDIKRN